MPSHRDTHTSPYSPPELFALVADVERYPEFLPWCRAARILERKDGELLAELLIAFKGMSERYTSRVVLFAPPDALSPGHIDVTMVEGPFEHLTNHWKFTPLQGGGTEIDFLLDFKFRSKLLETLMGGLFAKANAKMATAFSQRADALYGQTPTP